jgi:hypothetical protein
MDADTFRRFHRTHISEEDFEDALEFISTSRKYFNGSPEYSALLIAAIIAYARPFSRNEQGKIPPIDSRLDAELVPFLGSRRELHDRIISARNKAVAHAEGVNYPVEQVPPSTTEKPSETTYLVVTGTRWHVCKDLNPDLDEFESIAKEMRDVCASELYKMAESSYETSRGGGA